MTKRKSTISPFEEAHFRFGLIAPVIQNVYPDASARAYYRRVTEKPILCPDGIAREYKPVTLEKWTSAEPYFNKTLEKPVNEALRQRIVVHYNFSGLNPDELNAYVIHKIKLAGGSESIIRADALSALNGYCSGNVRTVDNVMSTALTLGAQLDRQTIDADIIMAAINEITLD